VWKTRSLAKTGSGPTQHKEEETDFEMPLFRATTQRSVTLPLAAWTLALTAPARCMWTEVRGNNAVLPLLRHSRSRLNKTHSFTKTGSGQMKKRKKGFKSGTLRGVFVLIASLAAFSYRSYSAMDFAQFDWEYRAGPGKKKKMVRPLFVRFIYIHRLQRIILPRQARGQHRESTQQRVLVAVFLKATRRRKTISAYE
jgi:hypothetical protein